MTEERKKELVASFPNEGKELLQGLINEFADKGIVFTNESQFQFELGFALQKLFDANGKNYEVKFEVLSLNKVDFTEFLEQTKDEREKLYTDLVVEMPKDRCVAIELKYKTAQNGDTKLFKYTVNDKDYIVFAQGAYDNGCYDFWWDVRRLEQLVHKNIRYNFSNKNVVSGFAVIMSNEERYWTKPNRDDGYYKNFRLTDELPTIDTKRQWYNKATGQSVDNIENKKDPRYNRPIDIVGHYDIKWDNYNLRNYNYELMPKKQCKRKSQQEKDYNFRYLILEVK